MGVGEKIRYGVIAVEKPILKITRTKKNSGTVSKESCADPMICLIFRGVGPLQMARRRSVGN